MRKEDEIIIPESLGEASELAKDIGKFDLTEKDVEKNLNLQIAGLKEMASTRIDALRRKKFKLLLALFAFYLKNQKKLTRDGKRKIIDLGSGDEIGYFLPSKKMVVIRGKEKVIKRLKRLKLGLFIRTIWKEELDKDAIAKNERLFSKVEGIIFKQDEKFMVKPKATENAITEDVKKLKRLLARI